MSREHIIPDWYRKKFPLRENPKYHQKFSSTEFSADKKDVSTSSKSRSRMGSYLSRTVRVVCKNCNEGWLSRLEECVKPLILKLATGERMLISLEEQKLLATWFTKTTMTNEYYDGVDTLSVPKAELAELKSKLHPPSAWTVMIAHYSGELWNQAAYRYFAEVKPKSSKALPLPDGDTVPYNCQATTFVLGQTLFHSVREDTVRAVFPVAHDGLFRIWPPSGEQIQFPTSPSYDDLKADSLCTSLYRALTRLGVSFPPFPGI